MKLKTLNTYLDDTPYQLRETTEGLALTHHTFSPLIIDFLSHHTQFRKKRGGGFGELLAKACQASKKPRVFDLTAGLGRDAFVLASLGCQVKMFERHPVIFALLCDGLKRLKKVSPDIPLQLIQKDSLLFLKDLDEAHRPDVIYLDPMHPARTKSALVKKEMRILSEIVGVDEDKRTLFEIAKEKAKKRVVVKWPIDALPLGPNPQIVYRGKSTRFDVYTTGLS